MAGDMQAQGEIFKLVDCYFGRVYSVLSREGFLLFSLRKVESGSYDRPSNNYAKNIEDFWSKTTDRVTVDKRRFSVQMLDGSERQIQRLKYSKKTGELDVYDPNSSPSALSKIKLSNLMEKDRVFVESALADQLFLSSKLKISSEGEDLDEVKVEKSGFHITTYDGMRRTLVIENKGDRPVSNLLVEYQSFSKQKLLGYSKDLPEEYRFVGYLKIDSIAPGEKILRKIEQPCILRTITQTVESGDYEYYIKYPAKAASQQFS